MSNLLTVDLVTSSQRLSPNSSENSMASPRSRPRLSFDESSLIKQQEEKRRQEVTSSVATINVINVPPIPVQNHIHSNENMRRASTPGTLFGRLDESECMEYRPSISNSSHPSLQEDLCSEIIRLDPTSGDHSSMQKEEPKLGRFVSLLRVRF